MSTIEQSIDVQVPLSTAYNQWTQFEEFPKFMEGVEEIRQTDDTHTHWRTKIGGVAREFDAEITEQRPDERVAWRSTSGTTHAGVVTFHRLDDATTRVLVQLEDEPEGVAEKVGDALGVLKRRVKGDLERFKEMIEARGSETGAWRGEVSAGAQQAGGGRFAREGDTAPADADIAPTGTEASAGSPGPTPTRGQAGL